MIFTFQKHNSTKKYLLFANDKDSAFNEIKKRLSDSENWSLIAYTSADKFSMFI